jgi:AmmeMemoRadiSam system protein B
MKTKKIREAGNRGAFYPSSCTEIESFINIFTKNIGKIQGEKFLNIIPRAVISPHAGYVYSGFTANAAHKTLANSKPKTVVVVGPSHHVYFEGVSAAFTEYYETPCGFIETDMELLKELNSKFELDFVELAHYKEHSTETQMPFIANYNPQASVVELIYGKTDYEYLAFIIDEVLKDENNSLVISSDLSHFYSLETAEKHDNVCISAVKNRNLQLFDAGCEACGIIGIKALMKNVVDKNMNTAIIDYRTSAEASGDTSSVVGYMSAAIW